MKLIVLRHGESLSNHENNFSGWTDVKLSPKGQEEAKLASKLINDFQHDLRVMYTSKLSRSIETGNIILKELDLLYLDQLKCWELNERHYGSFQGRNRKEVFNEVGAEQYNYIRRSFEGRPPPIQGTDQSIDKRYRDLDPSLIPNGESLKDVMNRFTPLLSGILKNNKDTLIITHGSVVRSIIKYLGNVDDKDVSKIEIPTGIPIIFELEDLKLVKPYYYLNKELALEEIKKYQRKTSYKI